MMKIGQSKIMITLLTLVLIQACVVTKTVPPNYNLRMFGDTEYMLNYNFGETIEHCNDLDLNDSLAIEDIILANMMKQEFNKRKVIYRGTKQVLEEMKPSNGGIVEGVLRYKFCANKAGEIICAAFSEMEGNLSYTKALKARKGVFSYKIMPDPQAPCISCGKLSIIISARFLPNL